MILGRMPFAEAVDRGAIHLEGPPDLVRAFPTWLGVTRFAKYAVEVPGTARLDAAVLTA